MEAATRPALRHNREDQPVLRFRFARLGVPRVRLVYLDVVLLHQQHFPRRRRKQSPADHFHRPLYTAIGAHTFADGRAQ